MPASPFTQYIVLKAVSKEELTAVSGVGSMAVSETVGSTTASEVDSVAAAWVGVAIQSLILLRSSARVFLKRRTRALCRLESYSASCARGILFSSSNIAFSFTKIRPRILMSKSIHLRTADSLAELLHTSVNH